MHIGKNFNSIKTLALAAICAASTLGHASLITYSLTDVTTSAGKLTGTVIIDSATDLVTTSNITFHDVALGNPVFNTIGSEAAWSGQSQDYISSAGNPSLLYWGGQFELRFNTANIGIGPVSLCLSGGICGNGLSQFAQIDVYTGSGNYTYGVTSGSFSPYTAPRPPVTSEPTSLLLLGTGMVFIAMFAYRRFSKPAESVDAGQ